jgi:hypothetical protein
LATQDFGVLEEHQTEVWLPKILGCVKNAKLKFGYPRFLVCEEHQTEDWLPKILVCGKMAKLKIGYPRFWGVGRMPN